MYLRDTVFATLLILAIARVDASDGLSMGVERFARLCKPGYQCTALRDTEPLWVQVDLKRARPIDSVKLMPCLAVLGESAGYPVRFRIEVSNDADFSNPTLVADRTGEDVPDPRDKVGVFPASGTEARYVRLTATKLREKHLWLSKLEVWSRGKEVAIGCPASDSRRGDLGVTMLTREARPQGEYVVTDNPSNVIPPSQWKAVPYKARAPIRGVTMQDRLIKTAMENNISYLLSTGTPDQLLWFFRERAGKPNTKGNEVPPGNWDYELTGSNAGRFLMGAGATLRFMEHPELRARLNKVVDGIQDCRRDDGFIMAYPDDTILRSERGGYTRSWVTQGLIEAGRSGNEKAYPLLRGFYDWFDKCPALPELLRRGGYGIQGFIANTLMYFTPVGKADDLTVGQRYFQENYWLDRLARRDVNAVWRYPYSHAHCYLLTAVEPYLDLYRATGAPRYLQAAQGTWDMYHEYWEHIGGSIAICEGHTFPPKSYVLTRNTGELCGNAFWARFSQRFLLLNPEEEKYAAEIEKSIYNVALANQATTSSIRYHAHLVGKKEHGDAFNSCCEGQGTRFYGSLPEYVYSVADDGLYVNLFAASTIRWEQDQQDMEAKLITDFPYSSKVELKLVTAKPIQSNIRVRVPGWATKNVSFAVNGKKAATGKPGSYVSLRRTWSNGDTIAFDLPLAFKTTRYSGVEETAAGGRYALEYGPVLMALTGMEDTGGTTPLTMKPEELMARLRAVPGAPLHFTIDGEPKLSYQPYWEVKNEPFTCFPVFTATRGLALPTSNAGNLALASRGTIVTADSELAWEPGCSAEAIDGIVASESNPTNRWHASIDTTNPHWIEVKLREPQRIGKVAIRFACEWEGYPISFQGLAGIGKADKVLFDKNDYPDWRGFETSISPMKADTFRLVIRESANMPFPSWDTTVSAAQISEIEIYRP